MVRLRGRPRPKNRGSPDVSFESTGTESVSPTINSTKLTVDTSSLTSSDMHLRRLPRSPSKGELGDLHHRIKSQEKREEQLLNDIAYIQNELEFSKKNTNRWKQALHDDVRPGSHYRKEIVMLKQELDKKDDDIQDREITIENLMAGNHPSHSFLVEHSQQTSVCSSLLDEAVELPQAREMERLLSENSEFAHKLRKQEEENNRLRKLLAERERDHIEIKEKIAGPPKNKSRSVPFNPFQITDGQLSIKCDLESASDSSDRSDSMRTTKRVTELKNELNKVTKERNSFRHELEQYQSEAKRLRRQLNDAKLHSTTTKDELVSKLDEVKLALYNSGQKEVSFASVQKYDEGNVMDLPAQQNEIRELKNALDESLFELEMAAEVMMEQRQTIQDLKSTVRAKEADYLQLQQALQIESESLEITKSYLMKKNCEIEKLSLSAKNLESVEKNAILKDDEIQGLQQTMTFWKDRYADLQKEMAEKEIKIDRCLISTVEVHDNLDEKRRTQIQLKDDGPHLFSSLKKENELLSEKTRNQTIQLQKADKVLFEKELEKSKLKTLLKVMQSKLDSVDSSSKPSKGSYNGLPPHTKRKEGDSKIIENALVAESPETSRDESDIFADSFLSKTEEIVDEDSVVILQNRIESLTVQTKDQQYEMDILVKKFAQLGVSNRDLEEKCSSFERDAKTFNDESLQLYNELVRRNCEFEPFKNYIKMLLDQRSSEDSSLTASSGILNKLESTRLELVNGLNRIVEERKVLQHSLEQKDSELGKLLYLKEEKELSARTGPSEKELLLAERNEKEEIVRQRNIVFMKLKAAREDLEEMEEKNERMEKLIAFQASSLKSLSDEVEEKDANMTELQKNVDVSNTLISLNADLKEKNAHYMERVDILLLEVEELKQEVSDLSNTNDSLSTLKIELEGAKNAGNTLMQTYERRITTLTTNKNATIDCLRKDLTALESQSADNIAHLTDQLSSLRAVNDDAEKQSMKIKDDRIRALEQTLHVQEGAVDTLRAELRQAQLSTRDPSEHRKKDLEDLQLELLESKSSAMNKGRECKFLIHKLDEFKTDHKKETTSLEKEIKRLSNESSLSSENKDLEENKMMLAAKKRLEQLKVVNVELKEDNVKLGTRLEQALTKIQGIAAENRVACETEKECAILKRKVAALESILGKNDLATKQHKSQKVVHHVVLSPSSNTSTNNKQQGKEGKKTKFMGWGKSSVTRA